MPLYDGPMPRSLPGAYSVMIAGAPWARAGHFTIRRQVFCQEQGIFSGSDRDAVDEVALPMVAATSVLGAADRIVGAVRIHQPEPRLWWGSRLAVEAEFRRVGAIGTELIRLAVSTANARGCDRFLAHVQLQNVGMFQALRWHVLDTLELHGRPHALMQAALAAYPAHGRDEVALLRPAARLRPAHPHLGRAATGAQIAARAA